MTKYYVVHVDGGVPKLTYMQQGNCDEHWTEDKELAKKTKQEMSVEYPNVTYKIFKVKD